MLTIGLFNQYLPYTRRYGIVKKLVSSAHKCAHKIVLYYDLLMNHNKNNKNIYLTPEILTHSHNKKKT